MNKIAGLGEVLYDILPAGAKLGGAPANFAYHVGQFGFDAVAVSAVGFDALGDQALEAFAVNGLKHVMPRVPYPTGTVNVSLDGQGVPTYKFVDNVAWDNIPFTPGMEAVAKCCRAVCFGSLAQRSAVSRQTIADFLRAVPKGCLRIFDVNLRQDFYTKDILRESVKHCDILKINDEELATVGRLFGYPDLDMEGKCRLIMRRYDLKWVVLTCGTRGSYVFAPGGVRSHRGTPRVEVADTVGAGDSFTAAFAAATLAGKPVAEAHQLAVDVSAYVCTQKGATPKLPAALVARLR